MDCFVATLRRNDGEGASADLTPAPHKGPSTRGLDLRRASFFARLPALICFSRLIASIMVSCNSYQTQDFAAKFGGEAFRQAFAMLEGATWQVGRDAGVERSGNWPISPWGRGTDEPDVRVIVARRRRFI